jgi:RNA polymerase sigma-70 factor (ECF subfamily)
VKQISFRTDVLPLKNELFRLAMRITLNRADAEDIVQETMLKVWNKREQWQEIESIEAFCLTICRNLALDRQKRMDLHQATIVEASAEEASGGVAVPDTSYHANPEEQAVQRDRVALVRKLMQQLPEKQRTCMQLRDVEGKTYKDIAKVMNITEQQVKVNIFRARQTIKQKFIVNERYGL